jgi:four helix bundle protein
MKITKFEDILAWSKAQDLAVKIYHKFKDLRDYGFRDQLRRAVISISSNIAEGFDRRSTHAEMTRYLYIASGSNSEVRSLLYLGLRLGYITEPEGKILIQDSNFISILIYKFIESIKKSPTKPT